MISTTKLYFKYLATLLITLVMLQGCDKKLVEKEKNYFSINEYYHLWWKSKPDSVMFMKICTSPLTADTLVLGRQIVLKELAVTLDAEISNGNFDGLYQVIDTLIEGRKIKKFVAKKNNLRIKNITTVFNSSKIKCLAKPDMVTIELANKNLLYSYNKTYLLTDSCIKIKVEEESLFSSTTQVEVVFKIVN